MRKSKVSALLMAIGCSSMAYGQSSVTLYGVVDPALMFVNNAQVNKAGGVPHGAQQYALVDAWTSAYAGSRFGLKGIEDLGGGTAAIFTLENGINMNSGALGQGGLMFGRQAFVGLTNDSWGTVTAGRQYSSMVDYVSPTSSILQWGGYIASHPDDVDNLGMTNRQNNAVKLATPVWNGFSANALYSFGGVAGSTSQNQIITAAAGYTGGPLRVGIGFLSAFDPNISMWGSQPNAGGVTTNNLGSLGSATTPERNPVIAGYASAHREQIFGAGATYTFAQATLGLVYTNTRFIGLGSSSGPNPLGYSGSASFNVIEANASYRVNAPLSVGVSYSYTSASGPDANKAHYNQVNAGAHYSLSKRTDVYMVVAYQHASGVDSLGQPAVASITGMTPSASRQQVVDVIGMAHRF
ncbi:porin [Paraburkholderia sp. RL17-337-BIB-A]|uniref:porin n=1 Tax=Paraburkholderia sp. RL17-337-BIB-A TaxID=3031636 RepID=UPI0038BCD680